MEATLKVNSTFSSAKLDLHGTITMKGGGHLE